MDSIVPLFSDLVRPLSEYYVHLWELPFMRNIIQRKISQESEGSNNGTWRTIEGIKGAQWFHYLRIKSENLHHLYHHSLVLCPWQTLLINHDSLSYGIYIAHSPPGSHNQIYWNWQVRQNSLVVLAVREICCVFFPWNICDMKKTKLVPSSFRG